MSLADEIAWRPSPNYNARVPHEGRRQIRHLILHYTGMESGQGAEDWLVNPESGVSSHYIVHDDGRIVQMVEEMDRAWHAGASLWRGLDRAYVAELLTCGWIRRCDNVLITGPAGSGKSFLGSALGAAAIDLGLSVRYVRTNPMLEQMALAHLDGSISKLRQSLISASLLILDDFGIAPITLRAKEDLLELLEGRIDAGSTIVMGQLAPEEWHDYLDAPHLADAIIDRLFQRSHRFALKGTSMRMRL